MCEGNTVLTDPGSETVRSQNGLDSEMGTVLFLIIWPLDTAPSVTPTPPVFSRFGPLGAFTVVRFPPPPFFNFRPRRLLELSISNKSCPSFFAIFCTYIPILKIDYLLSE